jgi:glutathione S-transferase
VGARLVTIPISHFCEKARWALDRAGVEYAEERHLQLVHVVASRRAGGRGTVPVLVTADGEVLADSTDILRWCDAQVPAERALYPAGELGEAAGRLEREYDDGLGPDGRLWMYHETLPVLEAMAPWALDGVPGWERSVFRVSGPLVDRAIRHVLDVDERTAAAALSRVEATFDDVGARLGDGRAFLLGDRFTAADLAFAALAAPLLLPERYGSPLPPPEAMPARMTDVVQRLRAHPAGEFAARLYRTERSQATPPAT